MADPAFTAPQTSKGPRVGWVKYVGSNTVTVIVMGTGVIRNVPIMSPLTAKDLSYGDDVLLSYFGGKWYCTGKLTSGAYYRYRREGARGVSVPPAPINLAVTVADSVPHLSWDYGGSAEQRLDHDTYQVDARLIGGSWNEPPYPVVTDSRTHRTLAPEKILEARVRSVDRWGNMSAWSYAPQILADIFPPDPPEITLSLPTKNLVSIYWELQNPPADLAGFYVSSALSATGAVSEKDEGKVSGYSISLNTRNPSATTDAYYAVRAYDILGNISDYPDVWTLVPGSRYPGNNYMTNYYDGKVLGWTMQSSTLASTTYDPAEGWPSGGSVKMSITADGTGTGGRVDLFKYDHLLEIFDREKVDNFFIGPYFKVSSVQNSQPLKIYVDQYKDLWRTPCSTPTKSFTLWQSSQSTVMFMSGSANFIPDSDCMYVSISIGLDAGATYSQNVWIDYFTYGPNYKTYAMSDSGSAVSISGDLSLSGGARVGSVAATYDNDLVVEGGISVGHVADSNVGDVTATGNIANDGGIHVGDKGGTCYQDDLVVDGGICVGGTVADPAAGQVRYSGDLYTYKASAWRGPAYPMIPVDVTVWNAQTNQSSQTLDLSSFGLPANIKGVFATMHFSVASWASGCNAALRKDSGSVAGVWCWPKGSGTDQGDASSGFVPCDSNGDIYFYTNRATNTITLYITGYII